MKSGLEHIFDAVILKNKAAFASLLEEAIDMAIGKFRASSVNNNQIPRTTEKLQDVIRDATSEARKVFESSSQLCRNEDMYKPHQSMLEITRRI